MVTQLQLGDISVSVLKKDIRNIHLSVHPPTGRVRISAPLRMSDDTIRIFAIAKLGWIKQHRHKLSVQERETPREFIDLESHYLWGKRYLLKVAESSSRSGVEVSHKHLVLQVRPEFDQQRRAAVLDDWYRRCLKQMALPMIERWEKLTGVRSNKCFIQRMKTKWGSCNVNTKCIRLNSELAKKPLDCLEYVVVHELTHLLEPTHNRRFIELMNDFLPDWKLRRASLNRLPLRHEHW